MWIDSCCVRRKSKKHILICAQRNLLFVFVSSIRMRTTQSLDECAIKINQLGFGPGRAILCLSPTLRETIISNLLIWNCSAATEYNWFCLKFAYFNENVYAMTPIPIQLRQKNLDYVFPSTVYHWLIEREDGRQQITTKHKTERQAPNFHSIWLYLMFTAWSTTSEFVKNSHRIGMKSSIHKCSLCIG